METVAGTGQPGFAEGVGKDTVLGEVDGGTDVPGVIDEGRGKAFQGDEGPEPEDGIKAEPPGEIGRQHGCDSLG